MVRFKSPDRVLVCPEAGGDGVSERPENTIASGFGSNDQLSDFFRWLTHTHTMRWHAHDRTEGSGHLYQGRFKTFPIEADDHLLTVLRYVERNPLRAGLCERAEDRQSPQSVTSGRNDQRNVSEITSRIAS